MVSFKTIITGSAVVLATSTYAMPTENAVGAYHHRLSSNMNRTTNTLIDSIISPNTTNAAAPTNIPGVLPATVELHPEYAGTSYWDKGFSAFFDSRPTPARTLQLANNTPAGDGGIYDVYYPYRGYCSQNQICRFFRITFKCPTCTNKKLWRGCCIMKHSASG